jgi:hypothetical protein
LRTWEKSKLHPLWHRKLDISGLEPRTSPHFEDPLDPNHSKDPGHFDPIAFDFYLLRPYLPFVPPFGFVGDPMNGLGGGVWQGRDMVLYNAFDWEHLRQKFMQLPGAPRSSLDAEGKGSSKNTQKKMVTDLQTTFADDREIEIDNLESALYSKPGYEWHWILTTCYSQKRMNIRILL